MAFSQVTVESSNEENDITKSNLFKFYPNPVEDELFIIGSNKIKSIEFIDVLGKRVAIHHFNKSIIKMDVSQLKSGIYLIQATDENGKQETQKLVVK
ncbi:T9SS type A sorting domain-containing protein [Flavivirga aquimarina]|uniref:T9SS type A sorting domain-containing protein n=1 Tax=Flavivirga aquimarina TaxID=2027862 RepID=A0ABT8W6M9_9FLAO|nr:T9SS type A sorting domain-containing protein [Flavivirga aquimarina]MDO5968777.1 T9SS type A sorting domain-containing protein [Flavivirga aquimarina]